MELYLTHQPCSVCLFTTVSVLTSSGKFHSGMLVLSEQILWWRFLYKKWQNHQVPWMHKMSFFLASGCDSNTLDNHFFSLLTTRSSAESTLGWGMCALLVLVKCPLLGKGWWCCSLEPCPLPCLWPTGTLAWRSWLICEHQIPFYKARIIILLSWSCLIELWVLSADNFPWRCDWRSFSAIGVFPW